MARREAREAVAAVVIDAVAAVAGREVVAAVGAAAVGTCAERSRYPGAEFDPALAPGAVGVDGGRSERVWAGREG